MRFDTRFNCGDQAWCFDGHSAVLRTIGQIRIEYTNSEGDADSMFSNYKPHPEKYVEVYMCVETGIGGGSLFTLGEHIFATREECETANAHRIAEREVELRARADWEREQLLAEEPRLRQRLAEIERVKSAA